jgi:1-acyl-sn-glycerol-3-phosphate acyltransferase
MALLNNGFTLRLLGTIFAMTSRRYRLGVERIPQDHDGLLLACVHLSHYDPLVISVLMGEKVDWMARAEFYETAFSTWCLEQADGFEIDRFGAALPGLREGLRRLEQGRIVGIFPEGEVCYGPTSVLNGGPLKGGVGLLARRSGVPVVPCVILNSRQFSRVVPWLPLRSGRLYIGFGEPIEPDMSLPPGRASRRKLVRRLEGSLVELYRELLDAFDVPDEVAEQPTKMPPHLEKVIGAGQATPSARP